MSQVTGQTDATATTTTQSETAGTTSFVNGTSRIVGSFNDETPDANLIIYGATTRHTKKGATQMGWSYSDNGGANWTYWRKPPASLRMGSAVGRSGDDDFGHLLQRGLYVQPCNPEHQISGGGIDGSVVTGSGKTSYIGGACIVKSKDGGKTFAHFQCVQNTDPVADVSDSTLGHFYDGGSMASTPAGEVFAAFVDVATARLTCGGVQMETSPSSGSRRRFRIT